VRLAVARLHCWTGAKRCDPLLLDVAAIHDLTDGRMCVGRCDLQEYDPEIFDDSDFYQLLLKDIISSAGSLVRGLCVRCV
jgi:hypothetical protein